MNTDHGKVFSNSWSSNSTIKFRILRCYLITLICPELTWPSSTRTASNGVKQAHHLFFFCKPTGFLNLLTMLMQDHTHTQKKSFNTNRCLPEKVLLSGTAAFTRLQLLCWIKRFLTPLRILARLSITQDRRGTYVISAKEQLPNKTTIKYSTSLTFISIPS